jgi:hypothetical protein
LRDELSNKLVESSSTDIEGAINRLGVAVDWLGFLWLLTGQSITSPETEANLGSFKLKLKKTMIRYIFSHFEYIEETKKGFENSLFGAIDLLEIVSKEFKLPKGKAKPEHELNNKA